MLAWLSISTVRFVRAEAGPLMPTVTELHLFAVDLPFKVAFRHAAAARTTSDSLFLRARLDDGTEGWGECAASRLRLGGEPRAGVRAACGTQILPALVGRSFRSLPEAVSFLEKCDGKAPPEWVAPEVPQTSAWCSVDLALLDAFGRASGEPVRPAAGVPAPSAAALRGTATAGSRPPAEGWSLRCRCSSCAPSGSPTSSSSSSTTGPCRRPGRLGGCSAAGSSSGSTPTWPGTSIRPSRSSASSKRSGSARSSSRSPADDLTGLARLVRESSAQIMVDEGLTDRDSLQRFITHQACTAVNVRISKCGGLIGAYARCREALDAGLMLQVGCQVGESSLLSAAHLTLLSALAPLTPGVRFAEGCFGRHLLREDPASPLVQFGYGGRPPRPPQGAGLGVQVDPVLLEGSTVDRARVT